MKLYLTHYSRIPKVPQGKAEAESMPVATELNADQGMFVLELPCNNELRSKLKGQLGTSGQKADWQTG